MQDQDQAEPQAEPVAASAPPTEDDLSAWYDQAETCRLLRMSKRWLNEQIADGEFVIERAMRDKKGRRAIKGGSPAYNPRDVDRIVEMRRPKTPAFPPSTDVGERPASTSPSFTVDTGLLIERVLSLLERRLPGLPPPAPPDRGPWLTIEEAAAHSRLSAALLRRVVRRLQEAGNPDVILDRSLKIRRAAVDELNAHELRGKCADGEHCEPPLLLRSA